MSDTTRILSIATDKPDPETIAEAARLLREGELVAFATETVYGLGADATNPSAIARIFEAKGRPTTNPLIVHVLDIAMARACVRDWPDRAQRLAEAFWPGPLTLVLPRSAIIPDAVTAGLETVGVRVPANRVALDLIQVLGRPIAAPSANRSTGISPTQAQHVAKDLSGRIPLILDSGPTAVGLESSVLDLSSLSPRVLRPGAITSEQIEAALSGAPIDRFEAKPEPQTEPTQAHKSPGQQSIHYAPKVRTIWVEADQLPMLDWPERSALLVFGNPQLPMIPQSTRRYDFVQPIEAAQALYSVLHDCEDSALELIVVVPPPPEPGWRAVRDRLKRASRPWRPDHPSLS